MDNCFGNAVLLIKDAIMRSRFQAAALVNRELLSLYYAVGRYVSQNSRYGYWGKGAVKQISGDLQKELPGLRGFSESAIKRMREFYEQWAVVFSNRPLSMGDLEQDKIHSLTMNDLTENRHLSNDEMQTIPKLETNIDLSLLSKHINSFDSPEFFITNFYKLGFTHHSVILAKEKSLDGRFFYISQCAVAFWTV